MKLFPARLRADVVTRDHVIDLLQAEPNQQIVIVEAPAGYGKSTVAAQWLETTGTPAAWISLDPYDNEPVRFFGVIVTALRSIDPGIGVETIARLNQETPPTDLGTIEALIEDLSTITRPCALVFDDYHVINDPGLHQSIALLLRNLPPTMRVLILSRSALDIPLSRFRARGELLELGVEDLRFTGDEARKMLDRESRIDLTSQEIAVLNERTEGWPAGLRLACHVLKGQPRDRLRQLVEGFSGSASPIETFLWEEVLQDLPAAHARFLTRSSIFDQFSPALCDTVFETTGSASHISDLDAAGMFVIPLDLQGQWYRYHHLFRDVLRHRFLLASPEDEVSELHRKAATWFEHNGFPDEAARHAIAGRDWPRAVSLLEPVAEQLYISDRIASLRTRLEVLPHVVLDNNPKLMFYLAWALARTGMIKASLIPTRSAEVAWTLVGDQENLGRIALLRTFQTILASDFPEAIACSDRARDLLPESCAVERAMASILKAQAFTHMGLPIEVEDALAASRATEVDQDFGVRQLDGVTSAMAQMARGKLPEAVVLLRQAIRSEHQTTLIQVQHALVHLGMIYVEQHLIDDAEQCFLRGIRLSNEASTGLWRSRFQLGLVLVARARGDLEGAFREVDQQIALVEDLGSPLEIRRAYSLQARLWLDANQLSLVHRWLDRVDLDPFTDRPTFERHFEQVIYLRLLLAEGGQEDTALTLIDLLRAQAISSNRIGDLIELEVLKALALRERGDSNEALAALEAALEQGEPAGYVRVFADEGEKLAPLLRHEAVRGRFRDYARTLLAAIDDGQDFDAPDQDALTEALSEREMEVLRLAAAGLPNRAIGEHLFITEKTVKKHISNILGKLQATNRTQAVDQARRLGFLPG